MPGQRTQAQCSNPSISRLKPNGDSANNTTGIGVEAKCSRQETHPIPLFHFSPIVQQ